MIAKPEFFLSDSSGSIGPLSAEALRDALRERGYTDVKVRIEGSSTWLPAFAWEAAGDPSPPPAPPPIPSQGASQVLPSELAEFTPKMREKLLWFLSDADGLLGPVSGEFIREGLANGKVSPTAKLCMIALQEWVRASVVFPKTYEGTTATRARSFTFVTCAYCLEVIGDTDEVCAACGERILRRTSIGLGRAAAVVAMVYVALLVGGVVVGLSLRARGVEAQRLVEPLLGRVEQGRGSGGPGSGALPAEASSAASRASSATTAVLSPSAEPLSSRAAPSASAAAPPSSAAATRAAAGGHLAGEVAGKVDLTPDAVDVLVLPRDRLAVVRKASVDVLDSKSGALTSSATDLAQLHALVPVGDAIYGLGQDRIAIIEPASFRTLKWLDLGAPPGRLAARGGSVLAPLEGEPAVAVIDAGRHAEIERFRFDERVTAVALDARAEVAVAATSDARSVRLGEDAVLLFDPRRTALAQPIRRVYVGAAPVAVAVAPAGKVAAAALLSAAEIARVDLAEPLGASAAVTRQKTCAEPILLEFAEASRLLLVGCRGGAALSLHDASSLAESARLDLGGPALAIDVAPDGRQALVVVGPPMNAVSMVDLSSRSLRRLEIDDEIASARYARHGERAAAFSLRGHRAWVLR